MLNTEIILFICLILFGFCISKYKKNNIIKLNSINLKTNTYLSDSFNVYNQNRLKTIYKWRNVKSKQLETESNITTNNSPKIIPHYYNSLHL